MSQRTANPHGLKSHDLNPYQAPAASGAKLTWEPQEWLLPGIGRRMVVYAGCGAALFVAFCTPANVIAQQLFWQGDAANPFMLALVVASSLIAGVIVDPFVRRQFAVWLVAPAYMLLNASLFAMLVLGPASLAQPSASLAQAAQSLLGVVLGGAIVGSFFGALLGHLTLPISFATVLLAQKL